MCTFSGASGQSEGSFTEIMPDTGDNSPDDFRNTQSDQIVGPDGLRADTWDTGGGRSSDSDGLGWCDSGSGGPDGYY